MADIPAAVAVALPLVKEFEGCRLTAYPDPETGSEPWTIGWGSTRDSQGRPFREEDWRRLRDRIPIFKALSVNRQAALLSFTYNCGCRWFGSKGFDTLSEALYAGQLEAVPAG